jgi:hypothetical protein
MRKVGSRHPAQVVFHQHVPHLAPLERGGVAAASVSTLRPTSVRTECRRCRKTSPRAHHPPS